MLNNRETDARMHGAGTFWRFGTLVTVEAKYVQVRGAMTPYEVADVLRAYGAAYRAQYPVTPAQARVMGALAACRTPALGGRVYECQVAGR